MWESLCCGHTQGEKRTTGRVFLTCLARAVFKGVHRIIGWKGPQAIIQSNVLLKAGPL